MAEKKTIFRTMAKALAFDKLKDVSVQLDHLDKRRLTIDEIKAVIKEALGKAKDAASVKAQEVAHGWGDAEIENEINWVQKLNLKEFFEPKDEAVQDEAVQEESSEGDPEASNKGE